MEPNATILPGGLTILDYCVLGTLLLSGIFAMFRGFVRECFSLVAWTAAYFAAAKYHPVIEPFAHRYIHNEQAAALAAGVGLFVIILVAFTVLGNAVADAVHSKGLSAIDSSLGFVFGLARGALIVCICYLAAAAIWWPGIDKPADEQKKNKEEPPAWLLESKTRPGMSRGANFLKQFIPEEEIKRTAGVLDEKKLDAQRAADQEALDKMSTPTVPAKELPGSSYGQEIRDKIDNLIKEKSTP